MKLGSSCCLDKDDNKICDSDEQEIICNKPYITDRYNGCCLDKNNNKICDYTDALSNDGENNK